MGDEEWTLANNFPSLFSKIPEAIEYSDVGTNSFFENEDEVTEKLNDFEFVWNEIMKRSQKSKSGRSGKSSARSATSNFSISQNQNLNHPNEPAKIPQKISHVVKKVKKKSKLKLVNNHYERKKIGMVANVDAGAGYDGFGTADCPEDEYTLLGGNDTEH